MLFFQQMDAQNFLKNTPFKNTFNQGDVKKAINALSDFYRVENDEVHFVQIVDSLPLKAPEVYNFTAEYMKDAYKITKYDIIQDNPEKGMIIGRGEFNAFESYAAFPNQYTFTCNPILRIDVKDGKARVCVIIKTYAQIRVNGNVKEDKEVKLIDVSPINSVSESEKMYNKVFLAVAKKALDVVSEYEEFIRGKQSDDIGDW